MLSASKKKDASEPDQKSRADYNMGNIYSHEKKWAEAVKSYKKALSQKANDPDAKHNYELALRHQKKQQQKKNQKKNKKGGKNRQKNY